MPRFAANLSMMFNEVPFLDRFAAARKQGFDGVEFLFPYEHPAAELRSVAAVLDVRSGDTVEPSAVLHLDDSPDRKASGMLWAALVVAAAAAVGVWYLLSRG